MPINEKDLGKYNRPAIFIEETDNSIVNLPVQNVLINLVPGFSKKGPFNKPVYVENKTQFETIYGGIDRQLENKGSYFHRTVEKMLESGPVWALNLLKTDPIRDKLEWSSVSTSASYLNDNFNAPNKTAYSSFFNRQDFWERDTQSFLDIVNNPQPDLNRLLHLTNMGDKTITTFILKSTIEGFNVTAEDWYGGADKTPLYINPKDWMSDYMVSVIVLTGDWTNYNDLKVDKTWSKYFTSAGLNKNLLSDFVNETNVNVLGNYDVSLIPYFKDLNGRDLYIKNVINNNTDKTGLFCAYNEDVLLGSDYNTNKIDIIGASVIDKSINSINYLSYNDTIVENITYLENVLDSANNVFTTSSANTSTFNGIAGRTAQFQNWSTSGIALSNSATTSSGITINITSSAGYIVIDGTKLNLSTTATTISNKLNVGETQVSIIYAIKDVYNVGSAVTMVQSGDISLNPNFNFPAPSFDTTISVILGTYKVYRNNSTSYTVTFIPVAVNTSYQGINSTKVVDDVAGTITITFTNTKSSVLGTDNTYNRYQQLNYFNELASKLANNQSVIISKATNGAYATGSKIDIANYSIIDETSSTDAQVVLYIDKNKYSYTLDNAFLLGIKKDLLLYFSDNEMIISSSNQKLISTFLPLANGILGKYSPLYQDYINGVINTGDYFFTNNNSGNTKKYLKFYIDANNMLNVIFTDTDINIESITQSETTPGFEPDSTTGIVIYSNKGNWKQSLEIHNSTVITDLTKVVAIKVDKTRYSEIKKGDFVAAYYDKIYYGSGGEGYLVGDNPRKLTRIIDVKNDTVNTTLKILYTDSPIEVIPVMSGGTIYSYYTNTYPSIDKYVDNLKGLAIKPFKIHPDSLPNGTEERLKTILSVLEKNSSLYNGLVNKNRISWRYLIDSFGLGLTDRSKQELVDLCGKKLNCIGFLNMPSAKDFKKSNNPVFTNDENVLSSLLIKKGGDEDKNPNFLYSFGTGIGRSTVGYFFPYININDNGIPKLFPPASFVATTYMQKHITSLAGVNPWTTAAGIQNGRIEGITSTEISFTDDDLSNFYSMGANVITYKINNGFVINSENTAQVFPYSSLSLLHSREVLIELENKLYDMLLRYQWKENTPSIRAEIKYKADKICKEYVDLGALYDFKNIIDDTNNTPYIIDIGGGVLDTHIEIVKSMGWIVNNIIIEKTGGIKSSGFGS